MAKNRLSINGRHVIVHTHSTIVKLLRKEGFTFRDTIRVGDPRKLRPEILGHEFAHCLQYAKAGTLRFIAQYLSQLVKHGYGRDMPIEQDATAWMYVEWAKGNAPIWRQYVNNLR